MSGVLKIILFFCSIAFSGFSEQDSYPLSSEGMMSFNCEDRRLEISFGKKSPIHIECSYPFFPVQGSLVEYVNTYLKKESEDRFTSLILGEIAEEEVWEDGTTLTYGLFPMFQSQNLISICGIHCKVRGCHGSTYYEGKNFWQSGNTVKQLVLDDLFIKGTNYRKFLLQYCENYFKFSGYGYYSSLKEFPPDLVSEDLDIFLLKDKGLMIVFRAYRVGGWADGPDTVLIPYAKLKEFINPQGPLAVL